MHNLSAIVLFSCSLQQIRNQETHNYFVRSYRGLHYVDRETTLSSPYQLDTN